VWLLAVELPQPLASVATAMAAAAPRIILRAMVVDMATSVLVTRPRSPVPPPSTRTNAGSCSPVVPDFMGAAARRSAQLGA
jgi:hypothetical protein